MRESVDKKLDSLSRRMVEYAALEEPSFDFTSNVLRQIQSLQKSTVFIYKPLISNLGWVLIATIFFLIMASVWFSSSDGSGFLMETISALSPDLTFNNPLNGVTIPQYMIYVTVVLLLMLIVQFGFLKSYLNNRFKS